MGVFCWDEVVADESGDDGVKEQSRQDASIAQSVNMVEKSSERVRRSDIRRCGAHEGDVMLSSGG